MPNLQKPEAQEAAPADLIASIREQAQVCERQTVQTHSLDFVAIDNPFEKLSFKQLGLIAFDPYSLDWWSDNESG